MSPNNFFKLFVLAFALTNILTNTIAVQQCNEGRYRKDSGYDNPDYIFVGGGVGGSVAARTCVEKGYRCTIVERGLDYYDQPLVTLPSGVSLVAGSDAAITSYSEPIANMYNKSVMMTEPFVLGGSSSINAQISVFTDIEKYYAELGFPGITYESMLPYYLNVTKSDDRPEYNGSVVVTNILTSDSQYVAFKAAIKTVFPNIPEKLPDMNTASINSTFPGFGPAETTDFTVYMNTGTSEVPVAGYRESAYVAYIKPVRNYPNLRVMTKSRVDKVLFDLHGRIAKKVLVTSTDYLGNEFQCELKAKKGIILSAGTLRTPQILMQSGVGNCQDLTKLGISVVKNMPDVGQHLDDHPTVVLTYMGSYSDSPISPNIDGHAYWNSEDNPTEVPNWSIQISGVYGVPYKNALIVHMNQLSRGSISLRSTNPADQPIYNIGHFSNLADLLPSALGLQKGIQVAGNLSYIAVPGLSVVTCPSYLPNCQNNVTEFYQAAYLSNGYSGYHYTGTSAFGKVVDPDTGLIYGFDNLYVVDASVLPSTPRGNTQITTYAMSQRLADLIF